MSPVKLNRTFARWAALINVYDNNIITLKIFVFCLVVVVLLLWMFAFSFTHTCVLLCRHFMLCGKCYYAVRNWLMRCHCGSVFEVTNCHPLNPRLIAPVSGLIIGSLRKGTCRKWPTWSGDSQFMHCRILAIYRLMFYVHCGPKTC